MLFPLFLGCSIALWQKERLETRFERYALVEHTVVLDNRTIHYWEGGNGPPLLLIHGFGGDGLWCWFKQLPLTEHFRVIIPDLLWFGESHSPNRPTLLEQVEATKALLDHLNIQEVGVAGISYGGFVSFFLAQQQPERVSRLALIDSPGPTFTEDDLSETLKRFGVERPDELVIPDEPADVRRLIGLAYEHPPPTPMFAMKDIYKHLFSDDVEEKRALIQDLIIAPPLRGATGWTLSMPTLLVWGEHDPLFPPQSGQNFAEAIGPHAQFRLIADTRHAPNIEKWQEFNQEIADFFLEGVDLRGEP